MMTRRLVQTNEGAGHALRRRLPPPTPMAEPAHEESGFRLFALSFAAFFTAFYGMIA